MAMATNAEYILWGTPKGKTDALYERVLYTQGKSPQDLDRVKELASADGWHSFRVQVLDLDAVPNFGATLNTGKQPIVTRNRNMLLDR